MEGGPGADRMFGDAGEDDMIGGSSAGNGVIDRGTPPYAVADGADWMNGGDEDDVMLGDNGLIMRLVDASGLWIRLRAGTFDVVSRTVSWAKGTEQAGTFGRDHMEGDRGNDYMAGNGGDDYLEGNVGDDLMWGNDGNDYLEGNDGRDRMVGGDGNDILAGNDDDDCIEGNAGDDSLFGWDGDDLLWGAPGRDRLDGGREANRIELCQAKR